MTKIYKAAGFTLIEVLIAIAIIAILAGIGYPSYQDHVKKTRRADAQAHLMKAALEQESWRITNSTYAADFASLGLDASNSYYDFTVESNDANNYTLKASAKTGTTQASDKAGSTLCTPLTLDQADTKAPGDCW
ncbi:type IV pilin protein [Motilimonas eburnea]|uniref:type IV pilin protein n=1 Tax=Motilimonas eburnea TaxID=1737488 RepID=UPI002551D28A|nr:type IV pilin protein [Motilimonas eburnea]MCE2569918.1 type IV pilin protein [Motilimonas eburnea]